MRKMSWRTGFGSVLVLLLAPTLSSAWNYTGHRVIASIAFQQLDEPTRQRVADLLRKHPAYKDLWKDRATNGPNGALNLFWNAAVFADDTRRPPWDKYNRPAAHFVNFRILANQENKVEPPLEGENLLNSYVAHLRKVGDARTPDEDRAQHLSWIFHQVGDIHQPLHAVARFSRAFPDGDRGGNSVKFSNPHARTDRGNNLHAYWDDLVGVDESPDAVDAIAKKLMAEYPLETFVAERERRSVDDWAVESVELSLKYVYNNLDPKFTSFPDAPVGYSADARRVANRRAALAGYRLGDELKRLFAEK